MLLSRTNICKSGILHGGNGHQNKPAVGALAIESRHAVRDFEGPSSAKRFSFEKGLTSAAQMASGELVAFILLGRGNSRCPGLGGFMGIRLRGALQIGHRRLL
jgi:hypothetical protein